MSERAIDREAALWMLERMRLIRQASERIRALYPTDVMETPVHLCIGQEAVAAGVCRHLRDEDRLFLGHRTHGPALAKGMPLEKLMAELYGRTTGCSHARGGSMHVIDLQHGIPGSSAIVGGSIALGVGAALASMLTKGGFLGVSWFGDAATNAGVFYESLNFAALRRLPVLFVCENNGYSNVMPLDRHSCHDITTPARAFLPVIEADGTDAVSVWKAAGSAVEEIRSGGGPRMLHCRTKRWMRHQGPERCHLADIVPERDCPIRKLEALAIRRGFTDARGIEELRLWIERRIDEAIAFAEASPFPEPEEAEV
ncbi:MAG: acetoin:2,6-dichlorophenolindophenol oxidoreductase subunit alpha [Planctomycetota bacterium]